MSCFFYVHWISHLWEHLFKLPRYYGEQRCWQIWINFNWCLEWLWYWYYFSHFESIRYRWNALLDKYITASLVNLLKISPEISGVFSYGLLVQISLVKCTINRTENHSAPRRYLSLRRSDQIIRRIFSSIHNSGYSGTKDFSTGAA